MKNKDKQIAETLRSIADLLAGRDIGPQSEDQSNLLAIRSALKVLYRSSGDEIADVVLSFNDDKDWKQFRSFIRRMLVEFDNEGRWAREHACSARVTNQIDCMANEAEVESVQAVIEQLNKTIRTLKRQQGLMVDALELHARSMHVSQCPMTHAMRSWRTECTCDQHPDLPRDIPEGMDE